MVGSDVFRRAHAANPPAAAAFLIFLLFPFYWMIIVSFKPTTDLFNLQFNPFWVQHFTLENYLYLFQNTEFPSWLKNTLIVSVVSTALSLFCSILIVMRWPGCGFPGSNFLGVGIFFGLPGAAHPFISAPGPGDRQTEALQHLLGPYPYLSHAADPLCLLAFDGVFSNHSQGD